MKLALKNTQERLSLVFLFQQHLSELHPNTQVLPFATITHASVTSLWSLNLMKKVETNLA